MKTYVTLKVCEKFMYTDVLEQLQLNAEQSKGWIFATNNKMKHFIYKQSNELDCGGKLANIESNIDSKDSLFSLT